MGATEACSGIGSKDDEPEGTEQVDIMLVVERKSTVLAIRTVRIEVGRQLAATQSFTTIRVEVDSKTVLSELQGTD